MGQGGRGRTRGGERLTGTTADGGKGGKGRAVSGDRPSGAAGCRPTRAMASYQTPPIQERMIPSVANGRRRPRREGVQGKGSGKRREADRRRRLQTATLPGVTPPPPRQAPQPPR